MHHVLCYHNAMFILNVVQVISAILLIIAILLQQGEANVGSAFGGGDISDEGSHKRRGSEKILFTMTILLAGIFVGSLVASMMF